MAATETAVEIACCSLLAGMAILFHVLDHVPPLEQDSSNNSDPVWRETKKWATRIAPYGLFTAAMSMLQIEEYLLAEVLLFAASICFVLQLWSICRRSTLLRVSATVCGIVFAFYFAVVIYHKKGNSSWSSLMARVETSNKQPVPPSVAPVPQIRPEPSKESFPFVMGAPFGDNRSSLWNIAIRPFGPITQSYNCTINFVDVARKQKAQEWLRQHPYLASAPEIPGGKEETKIAVHEFPAALNFSYVPVNPDRQHYTAKIDCPDASYDEDWEVARVHDVLRTKITLNKVSIWSDQKPAAVYSCVDDVSGRPNERTAIKVQDRYVFYSPAWMPKRVYEFPVVIHPIHNNADGRDFALVAKNPGCWKCLQEACGR